MISFAIDGDSTSFPSHARILPHMKAMKKAGLS
jgi:hypothetical protein